jgi:hypothetical protein
LALAMLVAASLCLPWRAADAMPFGQDDIADGPAWDTHDPLFTDDADGWDLHLPVDGFARSGLPVDPAEEGMNQVARSLDENAGLRQILSTTGALRTPEPVPGGLRNSALGADATFELPTGQDGHAGSATEAAADGSARAPGQAAAAARRVPLPAADPTRTETGTEIAINDGETLRDALRDVVGTRRGSGSGQADGMPGDGNDDPAFAGLGQAALDNRLLGDALDAFIRRTDGSDFEPTFSLFGLGRFSFDIGNNGQFEIAEYSSGLSISMPHPSETPRDQGTGAKIDVIAELRAFLATPTGTLSIIAASVLIAVWCMVRMATALRR